MEEIDKRIVRFLDVGYGYGNGYGNGYGYGDGYGNGNGYGDGYGDGSGSAYGILEFDGHKVYCIDNIPTIILNVRGNIAKGYTIKYNSQLVPCYIAKVDNCFAHGETAHDALRDATAKALQNTPIEERVAKVRKQYPDPDKPIPHKELYSLHNILTGSCEFGRREFANAHGLDPENGEMTMREFINLTLNAYGGENIKLLAEAYNI